MQGHIYLHIGITPIMKNQVEKNMENKMATGIMAVSIDRGPNTDPKI